ncbi:hypothetical protein P3T27_000105 [Kitasatospora sp. MAA19]|uniref:hypothetical protein n=1 Tax=Kitasatospora sp. MAA19 TaxID=3035090 RepID=UPI0024762DD7|nr:hypothetical protein [Kitasatospora sp. MAA19]MDH6703424.1 hypothetical protein [Kitasatospora sp. MAA19]
MPVLGPRARPAHHLPRCPTLGAIRTVPTLRTTGRPAGTAWTWFAIALTASLGANVATAGLLDLDHVPAWLRIMVAEWPALAFFGGTLLAHRATATATTTEPKPAERELPLRENAEPAPATEPAPVTDAEQDDLPADEPVPEPDDDVRPDSRERVCKKNASCAGVGGAVNALRVSGGS